MNDYHLLSFQQVAKVSNIDFFGANLSMDIEGVGFTNLTAVMVNGHRSPAFVVMSPTRVLAHQPAVVVGKPITSITVLKSDIRESKASVISFEASTPPIAYSPQTLLVQRFLKLLLTNKGSDIFSPSHGGDLLRLVGGVSSGVNIGNLSAYASIYVQDAANQLIEAQSKRSDSPDAKLKSVTVLSSEYKLEDTALDIRLSIEAMDGSRAIAGLVL